MVQWCAPALENLMGLARDHGDVVALPQFGVPFYLFNHPEQIEEILRSKPDRFKKASLLAALRPLLGDGLFTSEGEVWRQHRIAAQPLFCTKKIQHYTSKVVDSANRLVDRWQHGETRDFHADMMRLALEIVMRTLFDADATDVVPLGEELQAATNYYTDPRTVWSSNGECTSSSDVPAGHDATRLNAIISTMIEKRRSSGVAKRGDLLSRLLTMRGPNGSPLSDAELRDQMVTYFIGGQETTALSLSYTFALLSEHPEAETALSAELDRVLGGRLPTHADVAQLPVADAVIKESLRLFPPVWATGREALDDCEIGGHQVPRGRSCSCRSSSCTAIRASGAIRSDSIRRAGRSLRPRIGRAARIFRSETARGFASAPSWRHWKPCSWSQRLPNVIGWKWSRSSPFAWSPR